MKAVAILFVFLAGSGCARDVKLEGPDLRIQNISVKASTTIDGHVTPIPGASVHLLQGQEIAAEGYTNSRGTFLSPYLSKGIYHVEVFVPGYDRFSTRGITIFDKQTRRSVHAKLLPTPGAEALRMQNVFGFVTDGQAPARGVLLTLLSDNKAGFYSAMTDENGKFIFRGIPPGQYSLSFLYEVVGRGSVEHVTNGIIVAPGQSSKEIRVQMDTTNM